jgi:hypothetical protein
LKSDGLQTEEIHVYNAAVNWARDRIIRRSPDLDIKPGDDGHLIRAELGDALQHIRFPLLSYIFFAGVVVHAEILLNRHLSKILL